MRHRVGRRTNMTDTSLTPRTRRRRPTGEVVLGVDTHRDTHVAAVLSLVGTVTGTEEFPATAAGYRELLKWARGMGTVRRAGVEGTGSFGAALSRYLLAQGVEVLDVNRPDRTDRTDRRQRGKSDPLDAQNAARAVLSGRARARAKSGDGPVQIARMYKRTKGSAVKARTQAINQLKAVLVAADPDLREELAGLGNSELFRTCARFADDSKNDEGGEEAVLQGCPHHPVPAGPPNRAAYRADQGPGTPPGPARGTPRPAVAHCGGHRAGHSWEVRGRRSQERAGSPPPPVPARSRAHTTARASHVAVAHGLPSVANPSEAVGWHRRSGYSPSRTRPRRSARHSRRRRATGSFPSGASSLHPGQHRAPPFFGAAGPQKADEDEVIRRSGCCYAERL
ncbi:transposase [Streptomyces decoyicus]|uniref:IS110 family transposase n=1 Tax=Streptomyces decoyicus TaxID=249567 RepID=UPI0033D29898